MPMKQEMMGWQWHKLDHMQIISFRQTTMQAPHQSIFLQTGCSSWCQRTVSEHCQLLGVSIKLQFELYVDCVVMASSPVSCWLWISEFHGRRITAEECVESASQTISHTHVCRSVTTKDKSQRIRRTSSKILLLTFINTRWQWQNQQETFHGRQFRICNK